jgi:hypothetical protein
MAPNLELQKFRSLCSAKLLVDENLKNPVLCVSCMTYNRATGEEKEYTRSVALTPLMEMLADKIRQYHDMLHAGATTAEAQDQVISGRRHGQHKGSQKKRSTGAGSLSTFAGKHTRAKDTTDDGSDDGDGDDSSTPDSQSAAPPSTPDDGGDNYPHHHHHHHHHHHDDDDDDDSDGDDTDGDLPITPPGTDPMQVQGWFDSIKSLAVNLANTKAVKSLYTDVKQYATNPKFQEMALSATLGPEAGAALATAYKVHDVLSNAKAGDQEAVQKLSNLKDAALAGNTAAAQALTTAQHMNDMMNDKMAQAQQYAQTQQQVKGWLYNRPYRTNAQVLADGLTGKFPTVGIALREGWHDGVTLGANLQRKSLFSWP